MTPEELFVRFFLPVYPPDLPGRAREDANPAGNPHLVNHLEDAARHFVANAPALLGAGLVLDRSDESVHRLAAKLTRERRDAWAGEGAAGTPANLLFNVVVHGAAYVGACAVASHGGRWGVRRPLWESVVHLTSPAGEADLSVFHWWLKSLSDEGLVAASLADRYRTHVEVPCMRLDHLPVLVADARSLPRLKQPTFDRLHKYLRAHVPEIRDLGRDFPAAERFAEFEFRWIDFHLVGGGKRLLLAALSRHGMHLFWLGAEGFEKSVFVAGDAIPEPVMRLRGDRVVVLASRGGEAQTYETLWWGP